jgi:group I intron endonuclease
MIIYKITNKVSGKIYIGQTIKPNVRWKQHIQCANRGFTRPLYKDMRELGLSNFTYEPLDSAHNREELNKKELFYIKQYNCLYPLGYNIANYEQSVFHLTEEQRLHKSELMKKQMANKSTQEKSTLARKARQSWTEESKKSAIQKNKLKRKLGLYKKLPPFTELHKKRMSEARSFSYFIKSPDGIVYKINNLSSFCKEFKILRSSTHKVLTGTRQQNHGWIKPSKEEVQQYMNNLNLNREVIGE